MIIFGSKQQAKIFSRFSSSESSSKRSKIKIERRMLLWKEKSHSPLFDDDQPTQLLVHDVIIWLVMMTIFFSHISQVFYWISFSFSRSRFPRFIYLFICLYAKEFREILCSVGKFLISGKVWKWFWEYLMENLTIFLEFEILRLSF
jgi:hypothetical protein